jgi:hypothetical protein
MISIRVITIETAGFCRLDTRPPQAKYLVVVEAAYEAYAAKVS